MKYLINESQYRMLTGLAAMNWVKRRANEETMKDFIEFIQDMFVTSTRAVTQLKLFKAFAMPKDYLKVK